jgi:hypothetical protein
MVCRICDMHAIHSLRCHFVVMMHMQAQITLAFHSNVRDRSFSWSAQVIGM